MKTNKYKVILSSNSPRRKELFAGLGIGFEVRVISGIDESYPPELPLSEVPLYIAKEKAAAYDIADGELVHSRAFAFQSPPLAHLAWTLCVHRTQSQMRGMRHFPNLPLFRKETKKHNAKLNPATILT